MKDRRFSIISVLTILVCVSGMHQHASATIIRGVEVYSQNNEGSFPIIVRDSINEEGKGVDKGEFITIQFDASVEDPVGLKIRFLHCNRDWQPDDNLFVQDVNHNTSHLLNYSPSPIGVHGYSYRFVNSFPDPARLVRFDFSGNWIFRIMDASEDTVFQEGRFFVVDRLMPTTMKVTNDYLTENISPLNQIHKVAVHVRLHDETEGMFFTTLDVYQNRRFGAPFRIDVVDRDPYTFVDGQGRGYREFIVSDILPGNEYRTLDFSNANKYPNSAVVRLLEGADQPRPYWRTGPDKNGTAVLNRFTGINSEYLDVLFRLNMTETDVRIATNGGRGIFVVGPFNWWEPRAEDQLTHNEQEGTLTVDEYLRRGIYDYQYVTGILNEEQGVVERQDWTALEGNDWRTTNTYLAMVYYNEPRLGGFDRILGFARGNAGGSEIIPPR